MLLCGAAGAQTTDSVAVGRELGSEPRVKRSYERNVLGAPVYYDTLGNVIGQTVPADSFYHRPKHHFRNRLEDHFSAFFLEGQLMTGSRDMALTKPYSEKTAELIDEEVNRLIKQAHETALKVLTENREGFERLAALLLEREVVFSEDLETIFGPRKGGVDPNKMLREEA